MPCQIPKIHIETPLIYSKYLSDAAGHEVYLKLENTQPTGSFKLRGISQMCIKRAEEGCTKLVGSSGGNAGLALAYSAMKLNIPCEIFVPTYVTERMLKKIESYGTKVTITGHDWHAADSKARELALGNKEIGYVHPFDDEQVWKGNSTLVDEMKGQLQVAPGCIATSVGGGGLLIGILKGLERVGWKSTPILTLETIGAECFNKSLKAGQSVSIELTSIAKTLGARAVASHLLEIQSDFTIWSEVLSDRDAVVGCTRFADDHSFLVEPSCGVTLASIYTGLVKRIQQRKGKIDGPIVLVVCGGSDITPEMLKEFQIQFDV